MADVIDLTETSSDDEDGGPAAAPGPSGAGAAAASLALLAPPEGPRLPECGFALDQGRPLLRPEQVEENWRAHMRNPALPSNFEYWRLLLLTRYRIPPLRVNGKISVSGRRGEQPSAVRRPRRAARRRPSPRPNLAPPRPMQCTPSSRSWRSRRRGGR